ncbi:AraC family transcriptional regulator [Paenibacillus sp. GCM10027626]|uniref:helix-turn-helix transcriptional regulator n=1 Tax=Paenibacillus sp. GCM10027626 TaxID=3273411 RepID=UPI00362C6135
MEQTIRRAALLAGGNGVHTLFSLGEQELPLCVESIGYNTNQETLRRPEGYPYFHWLQTLEGEGEFELSGRRFTLPAGTGSLLFPGVPHTYGPIGGVRWSTLYVTFSGSLAEVLLASLGIRHTDWFDWGADAPITDHLLMMTEHAHQQNDRSGLQASVQLYHFITLLKTYGQTGGRSSLFQQLKQLNPLLQWLDEHYGDPEIGLNDMAELLSMTPRYLNSLFRQAFGMTAYAYLIQLRIRKAKELMSRGERKSVKEIAILSGYRDTSHFIAAFGKTEGMTPEQFRRLHEITPP